MSLKTSDRKRTRRKTLTRIRQAAEATAMREWIQSRSIAAEERKNAERKARDERRAQVIAEAVINGGPLLAPKVEQVHDYPAVQHPVTGRWVRQPYRNPERRDRLARNGRLRAELREEASA